MEVRIIWIKISKTGNCNFAFYYVFLLDTNDFRITLFREKKKTTEKFYRHQLLLSSENGMTECGIVNVSIRKANFTPSAKCKQLWNRHRLKQTIPIQKMQCCYYSSISNRNRYILLMKLISWFHCEGTLSFAIATY